MLHIVMFYKNHYKLCSYIVGLQATSTATMLFDVNSTCLWNLPGGDRWLTHRSKIFHRCSSQLRFGDYKGRKTLSNMIYTLALYSSLQTLSYTLNTSHRLSSAVLPGKSILYLRDQSFAPLDVSVITDSHTLPSSSEVWTLQESWRIIFCLFFFLFILYYFSVPFALYWIVVVVQERPTFHFWHLLFVHKL